MFGTKSCLETKTIQGGRQIISTHSRLNVLIVCQFQAMCSRNGITAWLLSHFTRALANELISVGKWSVEARFPVLIIAFRWIKIAGPTNQSASATAGDDAPLLRELSRSFMARHQLPTLSTNTHDLLLDHLHLLSWAKARGPYQVTEFGALSRHKRALPAKVAYRSFIFIDCIT